SKGRSGGRWGEPSREAVGRFDQGRSGLRLERRMPGGGRDDELGLGPRLLELPRVLNGAHHVVAAVDDDARDVGDPVGIPEELVLDLEEAAVHEVVVLDAGEGEGELRILVALREVLVDVEVAGRPLPHAPGPGGRETGGLVITGEAAVEGADEIVAL